MHIIFLVHFFRTIGLFKFNHITKIFSVNYYLIKYSKISIKVISYFLLVVFHCTFPMHYSYFCFPWILNLCQKPWYTNDTQETYLLYMLLTVCYRVTQLLDVRNHIAFDLLGHKKPITYFYLVATCYARRRLKIIECFPTYKEPIISRTHVDLEPSNAFNNSTYKTIPTQSTISFEHSIKTI